MERERTVARPTALTLMTNIKDFSKYHTLVKMKTYSIDFRQKIRDVYHNEPLSQRAIANRFCVTLSFVQKLVCTVSWNPKYCSSNWAMRSQIETQCRTTTDFSRIDWSFGWCNSPRTPLFTVQKNWFYYQRSNDGQNGKTLKHDFKKNSLSERERHAPEFRVCDMSSGKKSEKFVSKT